MSSEQDADIINDINCVNKCSIYAATVTVDGVLKLMVTIRITEFHQSVVSNIYRRESVIITLSLYSDLLHI